MVQETDGSGATQASYVLAAGELLAESRSGTPSYYLHDGQGSVRLLTNSSGVITDSYTYDAFGNPLSGQGTTVNPYRYTGQQLDSLTGLYYLRSRYYDPTSGRFTSADSVLAGNGADPPGWTATPTSRTTRKPMSIATGIAGRCVL